MSDRLNIAPTKSNLLYLKQQVSFLDSGYQLLERKREMLTRLVYEKLKEYRDIRHQSHELLQQAYKSLSISQMRMGSQRIRQVSLGIPRAINIKILPKRNMGVQFPSVKVSTNKLHPVGLLATDAMLDKTRKDFSQMAKNMAQLAEVESALYRLLEEQRKTQKRVNALKYNVIPRFQRTIQFIQGSLEEEERNVLFQLKVLNSQKTGAN